MFNEPTEKKRQVTSVLCDVALKFFFEVLFLVSIFICILKFCFKLCHTDTKPRNVIRNPKEQHTT